jgi:uncharacterized protein (DUF924 family)
MGPGIKSRDDIVAVTRAAQYWPYMLEPTTGSVMKDFEQVLDYWLGPADSEIYGTHRDLWYRGGPEVDAEIIAKFGALYERAAAGALDHWRDDPRSCLALILLFDQFPRNMFRGTPKSFATDGKAVELARHAVAEGFDRGVPANVQQFYYMPFEHSEDIADQRRCVELFRAMADGDKKEENLGYAVQHLEIIEQFGRFPHRNAILGRESTPEELRFLEEGGEDVQFGTQRNQDPEASD